MGRRLHKSVKSKEVEEKGAIEVVLVEDAELSPTQTPSRELARPGDDDGLPPPPILSAEQERRLWRKVDWRIMPIITIMYLSSFVDRSNIGECVWAPSCVCESSWTPGLRVMASRECEAAGAPHAAGPDGE